MPETQRQKCRHIFHDGHSCGSPALRNEEFCYFHHNTRKPRKGTPLAGASDAFELPIPEDRSAIQASIAIIVQRVAAGSLDARRAAILLRALKLAQQTLSFVGPPKSLNPVTEIPVAAEPEITPVASPKAPPAAPKYVPDPEISLPVPDPLAAHLRRLLAVADPIEKQDQPRPDSKLSTQDPQPFRKRLPRSRHRAKGRFPCPASRPSR